MTANEIKARRARYTEKTAAFLLCSLAVSLLLAATLRSTGFLLVAAVDVIGIAVCFVVWCTCQEPKP